MEDKMKFKKLESKNAQSKYRKGIPYSILFSLLSVDLIAISIPSVYQYPLQLPLASFKTLVYFFYVLSAIKFYRIRFSERSLSVQNGC